MEGLKKRINDKDEEEKKFIKKIITHITLMGMSFHMMYSLYNSLGIVNKMDKIISKQLTVRKTTKPTPILISDAGRISRGIFGFNIKASFHKHSNNDDEVVEIPTWSELRKFDIEAMGFSTNELTRVMIHDRNTEVVLFDGDLSGQRIVLWWKDGREERINVIQDGETIEKTVSVIDLDGKWKKFNDVMDSAIVRQKSPFRVVMWDEDDAHNSEWISSIAGEYGDFDVDKLVSYGFQNDSMQRIRVDGDADVELFQHGGFNGPSILLYEDIGEIVLDDMRRGGQNFPKNDISSIRIHRKNHFYAYVTFYDDDPGDDDPKWGPITTKGVHHTPDNFNDKTNWVVINRAPNGINLYEDANKGGRKLHLAVPDYGGNMGHHELSVYDFKNKMTSFEI